MSNERWSEEIFEAPRFENGPWDFATHSGRLIKYVRELRAHIDTLEAERQWRPIAGVAKGTECFNGMVWLLTDGKQRYFCTYGEHGWYSAKNGINLTFWPTHYLPLQELALPSPPNAEKGVGG